MHSMMLVVVLVIAAVLATAEAAKPHILIAVVDDWGWSNVGYHQTEESKTKEGEVRTPNIDELVKNGIELNRHYTYNYCSPSRCSLMSGRLPVHVSTSDTNPISMNPDDPVSGFTGIPTEMTTLPEKLRGAGYWTHMTGKWDAGMASLKQSPQTRFDSAFFYFHHANDYYTQKLSAGTVVSQDLCRRVLGLDLIDLWNASGPAIEKAGTDYEESMFLEESLRVIKAHDPSVPLFMYHAFHIVHTPLQIPEQNEARFSFLCNKHRRKYAAMVEFMDNGLGKLVDMLKMKNMWNNTLVIVTSDNGGPIYGTPPIPTFIDQAVFGAANNLPLRGGKTSDWEGGIRVNAFVSGGVIPEEMRGKRIDDYISIADWYGTILEVVGLDAHDERAEKANLPPVDSVSHWKLLNGEVQQGARDEIHVSKECLISGKYKLVMGSDTSILPVKFGSRMTFDVHAVGYGLQAVLNTLKPGRDCRNGCLFNIVDDPNEDNELTHSYPEIVSKMMARLKDLNKSNFNPNRGRQTKLACNVAQNLYHGFYGPFIDLPESVTKGMNISRAAAAEMFFSRKEVESFDQNFPNYRLIAS